MRELTDFCGNWLMSAENTVLDRQFDESVVNLPFIHNASAFTDITFSNSFTVTEKLAGETVYLEFRQVSGAVKIYNGETLLGEHDGLTASFRFKLTDAAAAGERFDIRAEVKPRGRSDGNFIFGKVTVLSVNRSHFDLSDCGGPGVYIVSDTARDEAEIRVKAKVTNPNNYDVVS